MSGDLKIDFDEVLFIPIPEEVVESVDQVPDLPGGLDFFFIFHVFLLCLLPFDIFDLENKAAENKTYVFDFAFLAWLLSFLDSCILQLGPWIWRRME